MVNWDRADGGREAIFVDESTIIFLFFNRKFPIFPIFSILSFLFSYFPIFLSNRATYSLYSPENRRILFFFFFFFFFSRFSGPMGEGAEKFHSYPLFVPFWPQTNSPSPRREEEKTVGTKLIKILMTMILLTVRLLFSLVEE